MKNTVTKPVLYFEYAVWYILQCATSGKNLKMKKVIKEQKLYRIMYGNKKKLYKHSQYIFHLTILYYKKKIQPAILIFVCALYC